MAGREAVAAATPRRRSSTFRGSMLSPKPFWNPRWYLIGTSVTLKCCGSHTRVEHMGNRWCSRVLPTTRHRRYGTRSTRRLTCTHAPTLTEVHGDSRAHALQHRSAARTRTRGCSRDPPSSICCTAATCRQGKPSSSANRHGRVEPSDAALASQYRRPHTSRTLPDDSANGSAYAIYGDVPEAQTAVMAGPAPPVQQGLRWLSLAAPPLARPG